ncbi:MAG: ferredoxin family protein [Candidatus Bathyarchaeia archaeon]
MKKVGIHINEDLCKGCGICINLCPNKVFTKSEKLSPRGVYLPVIVHGDKCTACRICEEHCPDLAIFIETEGTEK